MSLSRSLRRALAALLLLPLAGAAPGGALAAQNGRPLFRWTGEVDREVLLVVRGRDVDVRRERVRGRARTVAPLPRAAGVVDVRVVEGRGDVDVVQQPSARNDWTAVVRVRDERGGSDRYRVVATWAPRDGRWDGGWDGGWDERGDWDEGDGWERGRGGRGRDKDDGDWRGRGRGRDDDARRGGGWGWGRGGRGDGWGDEHGGSGQLRWSGVVDDVVEIRIQGRHVEEVTRSGARVREVQTAASGAPLPARTELPVRVDVRQGRGRVEVVEQPSARNDHRAILRVIDPRGGADRYDFVVSW